MVDEFTKLRIEKIELPEIRKISLWLDDYNDIFSDFDPRPFSERMLSEDFLNAAENMYKETKAGKFELRLLIPKAVRNKMLEDIIKKRLNSWFRTRAKRIKKEIKQVIKRGVILAAIGFVCMIIATLLFYFENKKLILLFLAVLFEPAGWFAVWYGLDQIFYEGRKKKGVHSFYRKLGYASIIFDSY